MRSSTLVLTYLGIVATGLAGAKDVTLVVADRDGAAARVAAPVSVPIDLTQHFGPGVDAARLQLTEVTGSGAAPGASVPVQFVVASTSLPGGAPTPAPSAAGTLWWLMPPGAKGERRFRLTLAETPAAAALAVRGDDAQQYAVTEGPRPVLHYAFGSVPVPAGTPAHFAKGESYARGDYITALYGPDGELLTEDYPRDHPHHRGVWWSWPVTRWHKEVFDIWAVVGVHARPVAMRRAEAGAVLAVLEPESVWKWRDKEAVVREEVVIRAFRLAGRGRTVDVEVRLTGLAEGVAIGGRPHAGYGGFALRAAACQDRKITAHTDPENSQPRRAWLDYAGVFAGGQGRTGVTIFENIGNPDYPNPLHQYPGCNCVMPAYPADREVPLPVGQTLVLQYRLWVHPDGSDDQPWVDAWSAYAHPPYCVLR